MIIIGGLLYASFFIQPTVSGKALAPTFIDRRDHLYSIVSPSKDRIVVVGSKGKVLAFEQKSGTWEVTRGISGTQGHLQSIDAWDQKRLVVVGNDGVALHTEDGGQNWLKGAVPRSRISNKLIRVKAVKDGYAYAVGESNTFLATFDYGATWKRVLPEEDRALYGLDVSERKFVAVGEFGGIVISNDAGTTWTKPKPAVTAHLQGVAIGADGRMVAVGLNGAIVHSGDGGLTWHEVKTEITSHLYDVAWIGNEFIVCGDRAVLFASSDGEQWAPINRDTAVRQDFVWFTQVRGYSDGVLLAGSKVVIASQGKLTELSELLTKSNPPSTATKIK